MKNDWLAMKSTMEIFFFFRCCFGLDLVLYTAALRTLTYQHKNTKTKIIYLSNIGQQKQMTFCFHFTSKWREMFIFKTIWRQNTSCWQISTILRCASTLNIVRKTKSSYPRYKSHKNQSKND